MERELLLLGPKKLLHGAVLPSEQGRSEERTEEA
jgi:hypothetical protein